MEALPPTTNNPLGLPTAAEIGRNYCDQLFAAEKKIAELPAKERQAQRLAVEKPMLRAFWCWLDELEQQPLAGGLKKAVVIELTYKTPDEMAADYHFTT